MIQARCEVRKQVEEQGAHWGMVLILGGDLYIYIKYIFILHIYIVFLGLFSFLFFLFCTYIYICFYVDRDVCCGGLACAILYTLSAKEF